MQTLRCPDCGKEYDVEDSVDEVLCPCGAVFFTEK